MLLESGRIEQIGFSKRLVSDKAADLFNIYLEHLPGLESHGACVNTELLTTYVFLMILVS